MVSQGLTSVFQIVLELLDVRVVRPVAVALELLSSLG